jgi:hypothetical protein
MMDCYSVDTDRAEELGDLPSRLLEQRNEYAFLTEPPGG